MSAYCLPAGLELLRYVSLIHALPGGPPDLLLVDDLHTLAELPAADRPRPRDMALCRILASLHEAAVRHQSNWCLLESILAICQCMRAVGSHALLCCASLASLAVPSRPGCTSITTQSYANMAAFLAAARGVAAERQPVPADCNRGKQCRWASPALHHAALAATGAAHSS